MGLVAAGLQGRDPGLREEPHLRRALLVTGVEMAGRAGPGADQPAAGYQRR
jgi:hypothetical protein